jgi:hypothetical protein
MVASQDMRELFLTILLIGSFSIAGLFLERSEHVVNEPVSPEVAGMGAITPLVANPVVHISVPAHNIFAPN